VSADVAGREPDDGALVAGLAREMEALRRRLDELERLTARVDELTVLVSQFGESIAAGKSRTDVVVSAPSWMDFPTDRAIANANDARDLLFRLARWVGGVYLRYRDAVTSFPDCWLWHPEIVEELLWLHRAWLAAYAPTASASLLGDWHERHRPGVVRRIKDYGGVCCLEAHLPGQDRHTPAPDIPVVDAIAAVATWWTTGRAQPGPVPTAEQLTRADLAARYTRQQRR
jgi:hypothetical protein